MKKLLVLVSLVLVFGLVIGCPNDTPKPETVPEVVVAPSFTPADESTVEEGAEITLTSITEGASVYYTNGTTDFSVDEWTLYDETAKPAVAFGSETEVTYKAIAVKSGMTNSKVVSATYTLQGTVVSPSFTPAGGEIDFTTAITLSTTTEEATIYYTVDGSDPSTASTSGTSVDISALTSPVTVKAIAVKEGLTNSNVVSAIYTKASVAEPVIQYMGSPLQENAELDFSVGLTFTVVEGATLQYKWGEGDYTAIDASANTGLIPEGTTSVTVKASKTGFQDSEKTVTFSKATVANPVIEPASGRYNEGNLSISISVPSSASVYYTTNGDEPSASSTEYTTAFNITISATPVEVKVIAVKAGMISSGVVSAEYKKSGFPLTMVDVPQGTYDYQGSTEKTVAAFSLATTEVTQAQWEAVMQEVYEGSDLWPGTNPSSSYGLGDDRPAYYVSWEDAIAFCNALSEKENLSPYYNTDGSIIDVDGTGYRLPTEVEWEYAAGWEENGVRNTYAGTSVDGNVEGTDDLGDYAWYSANNGASGTAENGSKDVGTKKVNVLGLYDMSGNVWEWCYDTWSDSSSYRVYRGGCWSNSSSNLRVAVRKYILPPSGRYNGLGLRVARSVAP